ncbi:hypothetical protein TUMEXPCC7403_22545 [Tumidithrix helvetica PCC 7403]|uniref:hypothetical protein n=1 Tax=Tumidithrix helvetica TaxID=3457545 RepID=UPI003CB45AC5
MMIDVPNADDFRLAGTDFLNMAWEAIVDLSLSLTIDPMLRINDDEEIQYWRTAQRPLSTALSLVQQGTEFLLKGHIADISPYLLLSGDWSKTRERFSECKTIEAQDLIVAYNVIKSNRLPDEFIRRYNQLRSQRNTIMHTVDPQSRDHQYIKPKDLLVDIPEVCHHLISPKCWIEVHKSFIDRKPSSILYGSENVQANLMIEMDHVIKLLKPSEIKKYFDFDKDQRCYICPNCYKEASDDLTDNVPKLSQLRPNTPDSNSVYCFICNQVSSVIRKDCENRDKDCLGNVISADENWCLTCMEYQSC